MGGQGRFGGSLGSTQVNIGVSRTAPDRRGSAGAGTSAGKEAERYGEREKVRGELKRGSGKVEQTCRAMIPLIQTDPHTHLESSCCSYHGYMQV